MIKTYAYQPNKQKLNLQKEKGYINKMFFKKKRK
jgi:hypothetical protein